MATNNVRYVGNVYGAPEPLVMLGLFLAGSSQAIKKGEKLKISASNFVPASADYNSASDLAIANEEIKSGDLAGYYEIIVPRPGDIFEFDLDTAAATAVGASLYHGASDPSQSYAASGSNASGNAIGQEHYPRHQGHASDGDSMDRGTSIRTATRVRCTIEKASSYFNAFQK